MEQQSQWISSSVAHSIELIFSSASRAREEQVFVLCLHCLCTDEEAKGEILKNHHEESIISTEEVRTQAHKIRDVKLCLQKNRRSTTAA